MSWNIVNASVAGTSHIRGGLPCQDDNSVATHRLPDGQEVLVVVVSDGAGSASLSHLGSGFVCEEAQVAVGDWLAKNGSAVPTEDDARYWFQLVRQGHQILAERQETTPREMACTFLMAIVAPHYAAYIQIGDGSIVVSRDGHFEAVFWPQGGEYANMTRFVSDPDAMDHLMCRVETQIPTEIAALTDGLQRLALVFATQSVHEPFFKPMFATVRRLDPDQCAQYCDELAAFMISDQVNSRTDDDKTLVLATRGA